LDLEFVWAWVADEDVEGGGRECERVRWPDVEFFF
jgi:hypothetical protein